MPGAVESTHLPTIAILVDYMVATYQVTLIRAVERAVKEQGANLLVVVGRPLDAPLVGDATQNRVYDLLGPNNVDGILLVSGCVSYASGMSGLIDFCRAHAPLPVCSLGIAVPNVPSLTISNFQGSRAVVEHLIDKHGARRIAYIAGPTANSEAAERLEGYLAALDVAGIPRNDALIESGDFYSLTGAQAMRSLIASGEKFDAVVAANDYMALGALQTLREHGMRVPDDVLVAGFDDAPFARFAVPSLTTVRQPLDRMARLAVEGLLRQARGQPMSQVTSIDVEVVSRQSCGCGIAARQRQWSLPAETEREGIATALTAHRELLASVLCEKVGVPRDALGGWATRLVDALQSELAGRGECFLTILGKILEESEPYSDYVDELLKVPVVLRRELLRLRPNQSLALELEELWFLGQVATNNAAAHVHGNEWLKLQVVIDTARVGFERIGTALNPSSLRRAIVDVFCDLHIQNASVGLFGEERSNQLTAFVTLANGAPRSANGKNSYPATQLVPEGFFTETRHSHVVVPLSFDQEFFGLMVMEYSANETVYGLLRDHVSSALEGGLLHRAALRQAAMLERVEREHLEQEAKIAARIQTDILPACQEIDGLQISARMKPAVAVGGDYYDIIPTAEGGWIGIGDVTGHGLIAGLIMLMLQGMVASMVRLSPRAMPSELISSLNRALYENVHGRLGRDDHATVTLLRYERNGTFLYAGAHEDLIVCRAADGKIETARPPGFWSGALPDVSSMTSDATLTLEAGDLLVLYSDGVTEAMNERHEQYGLSRLSSVVQEQANAGVAEISQAILDSVAQWQDRQLDDVTVLVARYMGHMCVG